jgi:hypothetical protein
VPFICRATESFSKLSGLWGYKISKKKAQLCLHQVTYLGLVLKEQTSQSPSFLSPFEIMYGHPFLVGNLPPTDTAHLADYLPYLNLLWELLREHADQILPHPITISIKPGILFSLRIFHPLCWDLSELDLIWSSSQCPPLSSSMVSLSGSTSQG